MGGRWGCEVQGGAGGARNRCGGEAQEHLVQLLMTVGRDVLAEAPTKGNVPVSDPGIYFYSTALGIRHLFHVQFVICLGLPLGGRMPVGKMRRRLSPSRGSPTKC